VYEKTDLAWAAGLFEGEGCISAGWDRRVGLKGGPRSYPIATIGMTDRDVIEHFLAVMRFGRIHSQSPGSTRRERKVMWYWKTRGFEEVQATVAMLWPWLGNRRRQRAREVLKHASLPTLNAPTCKRGHPWTADSEGKNGRHRTCAICRRLRARRDYQRRRVLHAGKSA
jgi:hypothetical protein